CTPPSVESTPPCAFTVNSTPPCVVGPSRVPLIVVIPPGEIAPAWLLAVEVIVVGSGVGAAVTSSATAIVIGLPVTPVDVTVMLPFYGPPASFCVLPVPFHSFPLVPVEAVVPSADSQPAGVEVVPTVNCTAPPVLVTVNFCEAGCAAVS